MKRRKFIASLGILTAGWAVAPVEPLKAFAGTDKKIKGAVLAKGKGLKDVVVSDGYSVVATDALGKYEIDLHPNAVAVFVSTPAGYAFAHEKGLARHYRMASDINPRKAIDFELEPLKIDDNEHQFIIWADPQVKNEKDVDRMMAESVPDVQKFVKAANGKLLHGITVGDLVWDNHDLFDSYNSAVEKMGIPFFQCIGNHDMDYDKGGDAESDDTFQQHYGPTWYSFNRGKVHYVVLDDVRYLGKGKEYDGYITQEQLDWLQKDLQFVPKDNLLIVCLHIPVHNEVKNNEDLYAVLKDRKNVHIMSGHTHYHRNVIRDNIFEHNHGTVCGAWWTGPICGDGTPSGYGVYTVKGNDLSWYYQSSGKEADHQMSLYIQDGDAQSKQLQVNVWNYDPAWKVECWVDGVKNEKLQRVDGFDPLAVALYQGPELPKPRGFADPKKTDHLFETVIPASAKNIQVIATDRFGKQYTSEYKA